MPSIDININTNVCICSAAQSVYLPKFETERKLKEKARV